MSDRATPEPTRRSLLLFAAATLLMAGCASAPPAPAAPTRLERIVAALKAMSFKQDGDDWYLSLPAPLLFEFDREVVSDSARGTLTKIAAELRDLGVAKVLVRGHTDNVGTAEYNSSLSKRRADAVAKVLVDGGFPADRINARGMGWTTPVADNGSAEGRA